MAFSVKRTLKAQVLAPLSRPHLHFTRDYLSNKRKRGIHILVRSLFLSLRVLVNSFTQVTPPCALFTCTKIPLWILRGMKIVTYIMDPRQSQNLHLLRISKILRPKSDCAHRLTLTALKKQDFMIKVTMSNNNNNNNNNNNKNNNNITSLYRKPPSLEGGFQASPVKVSKIKKKE